MELTAREKILARLKKAASPELPTKPTPPPLKELSLDVEAMVNRFVEELTLYEVVVHRTKDTEGTLKALTEIAATEQLKYIVVSADSIIASLNLKSWGCKLGITVQTPQDFSDRNSFKDALFQNADAGITGADYGVAESGTLGIIHDKNKPRLISLAPPLHIAVVPVKRIVPVYENIIENVYVDGKELPSQLTYITGPSMTADIQAKPFKGMHGPRKLIVIIIG